MMTEPSSSSTLTAGTRPSPSRPTAWWWWPVCLALIAGMGYLRLVVYPDQVIPLTYALPLLTTLWHRNLKLHWFMAFSFVGMMAFKLFVLVPEERLLTVNQWIFVGMQLTNIFIAAWVIHAVVGLTMRLESTIGLLEKTNTELEASNEELAAREEEITQQNEELQSQAEELEQQTEELNTQTEELQTLNEQLAMRERTLGDLLESFAGGASETETLARLGETVERLLGSRACAAAVLEPNGNDMLVRPLVAMAEGPAKLKRDRTLAELILRRDRAGFLADIALRPDLDVPRIAGTLPVRSLAAAPLRVGNTVAGVLEVYSTEPGEWSEHDLRVVQWLAEQCGRLWTTARLREELDGQRRLLRSVTDTSTIALFMTDERGYCTYLNPAARRLTGYALRELQNGPLHEMLNLRHPWPGNGAPVAPSTTHPDDAYVTPRDDEFLRKSGERLPVLVAASPVISGGKSIATVIEMRDATELRKHELEREQLLERERAARSEAERANRAKDEFVATLSHELRTPLNAVLGWAVLLKKSAGSNAAEVMKGVEVIERNARHQSQLISDLLDMSRIMTGKIRLDIQSVDLPLVVESALEAVRLAAEAKGVKLERVIETVDRIIMGDPGRIQQVVWNLLSNAIKFTPKDGSVHLMVSRVASSVQITVSDTGDGIEPSLMPHLFERYRQGDGSSTRRHGGLGLGLAIAKHLVELHGGTIHARSDGPGKGSTFTVMLPVRAVVPSEATTTPHPTSLTGVSLDSNTPTLSGLSILIVDDEDDARELLRRVLADCGASVLMATSGDEALEMIERDTPDLLISDISMPKMDGYTLIRTLRHRGSETVRSIPAIALTAFARSEDRTRAMLAGFQSHIAKPVEAAELVATIASLRYAVPRVAGARLENVGLDDSLTS